VARQRRISHFLLLSAVTMMQTATIPVLYLAFASLLACTIIVSSGSMVPGSTAFMQKAMTPPTTMVGNIHFQNMNNKPPAIVGLGLRLHGRHHLGRHGKASFPPIQSTFMAANGAGPSNNDDGGFSSNSTPELKKLLKDKGMSTAGNRAELIQRLKGLQNTNAPSNSPSSETGKANNGFATPSQGPSKEKPVQGFGSKKPNASSDAGSAKKGFSKPTTGFAKEMPAKGFGSNKDQAKDKMNSAPSATPNVTTTGPITLRESAESPPVASVQGVPLRASDQNVAASGVESGEPSNSMKLASKDEPETCAQPTSSSSLSDAAITTNEKNEENKGSAGKVEEQARKSGEKKLEDSKSTQAGLRQREEQGAAEKQSAEAGTKQSAEGRISEQKTAEQDKLASNAKTQEDKPAVDAAKIAGRERVDAEWRSAQKKTEEERIAATEKAEQDKIAAEAAKRKAEGEWSAAEKKSEEDRVSAKRAEEEKKAADKRLEDERVAAAKKIEEDWIAAQKVEKEKRASSGQVCMHVHASIKYASVYVCAGECMYALDVACLETPCVLAIFVHHALFCTLKSLHSLGNLTVAYLQSIFLLFILFCYWLSMICSRATLCRYSKTQS
jgi:hypothetical protein